MKTKLLLLGASLLLAQNVVAKTTVCYKNNWEKPSTIETVALEGGECKGEFSLKQMKAKGWFVEDILIKGAKKGLNYSYVLNTTNPVKVTKEDVKKNIQSKKPVSFDKSDILISNVSGKTATINIGNLKVGQSGIIEHKYDNGKTLIISSAYVQESSSSSSTLKFIPFVGLNQNAIPTSNRTPENGDRFMLNYLYDESLLIAPNAESFRNVRNKFQNNNFPHSDIFAAYLKVNTNPTPNKNEIQEYALSQNMGTIFIVIETNVYIVDSRTLTILGKRPVSYLPGNEAMPFYTRVEKIEESIIDQAKDGFFGFLNFFNDDDKTEDEKLYGDLADDVHKNSKTNYTVYYKNLLGLLDD